ncbi:MAG: acetyl-CoA synthetase [Ruminococcaceae bacterium]|nr:acetyl-CoA synthetase [Oscillospiraceae bacterium]
MTFLDRYLPRKDFKDYKDFKANYQLNIPESFNFAFDIVDGYAKEDPDKLALLYYNDDKVEKRITFAEMKRLSDKAANAFRQMGIGRGDRVMLILRQRIEVWVCFTALCKLGAVCIPATFQLTPKDIIYRCNAASIKCICAVDDEELVRFLRESRGECKTLENICLEGENIEQRFGADGFRDLKKLIEEADESFERTFKNANDEIMLIYFSSGTTGMPKMIQHDYTYPLGHITTAYFWQHVEDGGLHLTMSDSGWAKFGWGKIYGQWIAGAAIVAYDHVRFDAVKTLEAIDHLKLTTFCAPPTIYRFLIQEDMSKYDFSSLHHCCTAGEPLNPEVFNRFYEYTGHKIHEGFGQTETTVILANFGWDEIKVGSTGKPSPLYDIDIVDENGKPCEDGVVGTIMVKNASSAHPAGLFKGYFNDEAAMARSWKNGMYDTGDTAWRDSEGYYHFEGRNDDVIKCSGYRIGPFEVESALITHPAVVECAITAVPDPIRGQVVKATIVLARGYEASDELKKELQNHVKKTTAPYKYPRVVEFVKELPKTLGGKIKRNEIRKNDEKN